MPLPDPIIASGLTEIRDFFNNGGTFMYALALTSFVAISAIVFKVLSLRRSMVIPVELENEVNRSAESGDVSPLASRGSDGRSALSRLCGVALKHRGKSRADITEAVQASARDEIVQMNSGMIVLDTVITVAPLFGLLGTASGLVVIFQGLGETTDYNIVGKGIARALDNTIVGLAVAVPAVIAHGWFSRRIEVLVSRLEVLLAEVARACEGGTSPLARASAPPVAATAVQAATPALPRIPERP